MITREKCPNCGSNKTAEIIYGMATYEMSLQEQKGEIKIGGCCVSENDPRWHCFACGHEFGVYTEEDE